MKKLGLVGGISWVSTIDYYKYINEGINERLGGLNYAECLIYSLNFADIHKVGWDHSFDLLHKASNSLKKGGAEAIVLCCNTGHMMAELLEEKTGLPIIHIVSATAGTVKKQSLKRVGLLGTKFTMEMNFFKDKLKSEGIDCIIPEQQETRDYIQHTLKEELGRGLIKQDTKERYLSIINELIRNGAEGIILGCTEIPLLISQKDIHSPLFDTTKIHADAAVAFALS